MSLNTFHSQYVCHACDGNVVEASPTASDKHREAEFLHEVHGFSMLPNGQVEVS